MTPASPNFAFLAAHDPQLVRLGALAERYFADDPSTALIKLRQFGEALAQLTAARSGLFSSAEESQAVLLNRLKLAGVLPQQAADLFHLLRVDGNRAVHEGAGDHARALSSSAMPEWKNFDVRIAGIDAIVPADGALQKANDVDRFTNSASRGVVSRAFGLDL